MKKIKSGLIELNKIKYVENSRLRAKDDVSDLMIDIENHGLLQPVGIRLKDNALIYGNRRVKAFEKLNYDKIPCEYFEDVSDEDLIILNLIENIKRKNIGSIEIGRMCSILIEKGLSNMEVAARLGINSTRVHSALSAYRVTVDTPFESLVIFGSGDERKGVNKNMKGKIAEGIIWHLQTSLSKALGKKITKQQWAILLRAIEEGKIVNQNIPTLRYILLMDKNRDIARALELLDKTKIVYAYLSFNEDELIKAMRKEKIDNNLEFIKHIIKGYNKDLIF